MARVIKEDPILMESFANVLDKYLKDSYKLDKNNFNGVINENPKDNTSDYFVSIKGKSVIFE